MLVGQMSVGITGFGWSGQNIVWMWGGPGADVVISQYMSVCLPCVPCM